MAGEGQPRGRLSTILGWVNPSYRRRMDQEAALLAQKQEAERKNAEHFGHLQDLYKALSTGEILSNVGVSWLRGVSRNFTIGGVGGFVVGPTSEAIKEIMIGDPANPRIFDVSAITSVGSSIVITDNEDQNIQLIEGLTKASMGIVRAFEKYGRKPTDKTKSTKTPRRVHGEAEGISYSVKLQDASDRYLSARSGSDVIVGEIVLYVGDVLYIVTHDSARKMRSIHKYDMTGETHVYESTPNNTFDAEDIELLNKLIPSFAHMTADEQGTVKPPGIYGN